jgi:hypothetical protein
MNFHEPPRFPRGFRCASRNVGLKPKAKDLALFASDVEASAAAVFTRNHFPGAPIILGRETIRAGRLRGIVANSKVSNVATGERGVEHARRMAAAAAQEIGHGVQGLANADAARGASVIIAAVPWEGHGDLLSALAGELAGKIVVDCVNPLGFDNRGAYALPVPEGSAAQQAAAVLPGTRVSARSTTSPPCCCSTPR